MSCQRKSDRKNWAIIVFVSLLSCGAPLCAEVPLPKGYIEEAPLPEGVPPPSETGKVVEKTYPLVRSYSATGRGQFMKCFGYLSLRNHKMTAPVVMEYESLKDGDKIDPKEEDMPVGIKRMHFLLEQVSLDEPKKAVLVVVADMPKMRVLSIAHQGKLDADVVNKSEGMLAEELKARRDLVSDGPPRILCYNGPSVSEDKVYFEIQLPVKAAAK